MRLDSLTKDALIKAIAVNLHGFELIEHGPKDEYPYPAIAFRLQEEAKLRLNTEAKFKAQVFKILSAIEFVLEDPETVEQRNKDRIALTAHLVKEIADSLKMSDQVVARDVLGCRYD